MALNSILCVKLLAGPPQLRYITERDQAEVLAHPQLRYLTERDQANANHISNTHHNAFKHATFPNMFTAMFTGYTMSRNI